MAIITRGGSRKVWRISEAGNCIYMPASSFKMADMLGESSMEREHPLKRHPMMKMIHANRKKQRTEETFQMHLENHHSFLPRQRIRMFCPNSSRSLKG